VDEEVVSRECWFDVSGVVSSIVETSSSGGITLLEEFTLSRSSCRLKKAEGFVA